MKSYILMLTVLLFSSAAFAAKVDTPKFTPAAGTYNATQSVSITVLVSTATIRYTTDGSAPSTTRGTIYTAPVTVSSTATLKAIAYASGYSTSDVGTALYTLNLLYAATPTFSVAAGTYATAQSVTLSTTTTGASINYTTDGTTPSATVGTLYTGAISVSANTTINAIAFKTGIMPSTVASAAYTIKTAVPTFTPAAGTYSTVQSVTLASATTGASIRYTTDGTTPTASAGNVYSSAIAVNATTTIKAIAYKTGMNDSDVSSATYTINLLTVGAPSFSPVAGTYASAQSVAISSATTGASIRYTTDGTTPTSSTGTVYSSAVTVSSNTTLKAIAYKSGMLDSNVTTAAYNIQVAAPAFSPVAGTFSTAQSVTLASTTTGATIRYTTDGSTPTASTGTIYSAAIAVNATTTIKAIAYKTGMNDSDVSSATYTINLLTVADPSFTPAAGTYTSAQSVAITSNTTGATIRYTTDGTTPTASNGTVYSSAVTVNSNTTLKAIATKSGMLDSNVASAAYTIKVATPVITPSAGTYNTVQSVSLSTTTVGATIRYTTDGSTPTSSNGNVYSTAFEVGATATVKAMAYKSGLTDSDVATATFTINLLTVETPSFTPAAGTYTGDQSVEISSATSGATIRFTTDGTTPSASAGTIYTGAVTVSANETLKAIAYKSGMLDSGVSTAVYAIRVATPAFSPIPGTFTTIQNITITTTTSGATIYYTTDGSTPSASSTVYTTPVTLASTATIKAIAIKTGLTNSIILSGTFNIQLVTVATPTFTPAGGTFNNDQSVTIASATAGASIRYTTDGTLPTATTGTVYSAAVTLSATTNLKAIAYKDGLLDSGVASDNYVLKCATPSFNPPASNIDRPQRITISESTTGTVVRYTTDGSEPTQATGIIYSTPVQVNTGQTLKAIAFKTGYTNSDTGVAAYTLTSPDTDGDGVVDPEDEYPTDPTRAFNTFMPATGNGTVAFEDLWPAKGDYDMNDVVVDYSFKTVTNGANQLVETFATFVLRASGAALHNGFGFQFANSIIPSSAITVTGSDLTQHYITLAENGLEANQAKPVVIVFDNAFDLFANPLSGSGFNTTPGANYVQPTTINIHIVYTPNTYSAEALDLEHFNPFIIVNMVRGKEVHLPDYAPTSLADMSLFGTLEDNSNPAQGRYYRTSNNAPWALSLYENFDYPIEKASILKAYLHFADWVQSAGTQYPDWYKNLPGYRSASMIYQKK